MSQIIKVNCNIILTFFYIFYKHMYDQKYWKMYYLLHYRYNGFHLLVLFYIFFFFYKLYHILYFLASIHVFIECISWKWPFHCSEKFFEIWSARKWWLGEVWRQAGEIRGGKLRQFQTYLWLRQVWIFGRRCNRKCGWNHGLIGCHNYLILSWITFIFQISLCSLWQRKG